MRLKAVKLICERLAEGVEAPDTEKGLIDALRNRSGKFRSVF